MINDVINISKNAGTKILEVYNSNDFKIQVKHDKSPVTEADLISHEIIANGLSQISKYPVLSEECIIDYSVRRNWHTFWIVDPLDGTKDFIAKNDQFTVNVALIEDGTPVLGVIYAPALGLMYSAKKDCGAFKNGKKIYNNSKRQSLIATDSNFHSVDETVSFLKKNNISNVQKYGSSLKFGKLAEGKIDIYPRFNGSKEWDIAAGHIVLKEAGCKILDLDTQFEVLYNKENIKNNYFIAMRNDLEINYESNYISSGTRN